VLLDLDDHPYAWNAFFPDKAMSEEEWGAHDEYIDQFNAVLCSTKYLVDVMTERWAKDFATPQRFEYAPNLYDPWRYDPSTATFGKRLGTHIFVKARDKADFEVMGAALRPIFEADPTLEFLHIGEEFAGECCGHPVHHHYEGTDECDDCACEKFVPGTFDTLSAATGIPWDRIEPHPACNPSELPAALPQINVGVVPLADSPWNYAKTEGKGFEYAAAGIPFVALTGDHPLYKKSMGFDLVHIGKLTTDGEIWERCSRHSREWAERIAQEHQIEYVATMKRLAAMDLKKPISESD
jgi:hypothetical protein